MKIYLGSDHAAYGAKIEVKNVLEEMGYQVEDLGSHSEDRVNYPDYALKVSEKVLKNPSSKGILLCGSGIGMSIMANKFKGIRAALVKTKEEALLSRQHNDANILCLGARTTDLSLIKEIVGLWPKTEFEGGRHQDRIDLMNVRGEELN